MNIKTKLLTTFLLISLIPMLFIGTILSNSAGEIIVNEELKRLELLVIVKEDEINREIKHSLERLAGVTSRTQLRNSLESYNQTEDEEHSDKINSIIKDANNSIDDFIAITVFSAEGEEVTSTGDISLEDVPADFVENKSQQPEYSILILDGIPTAFLIGPLSLDDQNIGTLLIKAIPSNILSIMEAKGELTGSLDLLLAIRDSNGDALFITNRKFGEETNARSVIPKEETTIPITQALMKNEDIYTNILDYRGEKVFASTRYIDTQDWGLVAKIDSAEITDPLTKLQQLVFFIGSLSLLIVATLAYFIAKSISYPIQNLTSIADDISRGNLSSKLDESILTSKDETGDLARAFERIVTSLKLAMLQTKESETPENSEKTVEKPKPKSEKI